MKRIKQVFLVLFLGLSIPIFSFAQFKSTTKEESVSPNMKTPETLVMSFIKDYYLWNRQAFDRFTQLQKSETSALSAAGITEPFRPDQIRNLSKFAEIKSRYAGEYGKMDKQADDEYKEIIRKYCRSNYKHLNISYGSESAHDPENEIIVLVKTKANKSIVKTELSKVIAGDKYTDDYEFHLMFENDRWYLEQIYYVNEEGRYESL